MLSNLIVKNAQIFYLIVFTAASLILSETCLINTYCLIVLKFTTDVYGATINSYERIYTIMNSNVALKPFHARNVNGQLNVKMYPSMT